MRKIFFKLSLVFLFMSCNNETKVYSKNTINQSIEDSQYVKNSSFKKGDIRRYGIYPNKPINNIFLGRVICLAEKGLQIYFPQGIYDTSIVLEGVSNINFDFDDAVITGAINIMDKDSVRSEFIKFNGTLNILDKLFIRQSNNIDFDTVLIKSDTINNIFKKKNRGVSIYAGSKHITFNKLSIENTGGNEDEFFKHTASALQVHGWNNNPENLIINKLFIKNSDRTALYLTGNNHNIKNIKIENFGLGSNINMFGLEDVKTDDEKNLTGAWINKCNDCIIDSLSINNKFKKGVYSAVFGIGNYSKPTFINNIQILNKAKELPINDDPLTNILVKNTY